MWPAAPLAPAFGSLKPDDRRKLRPVDRIKPFVLGADWHRAFQRRGDFAPIRETRLVRDSRQSGARESLIWRLLGFSKGFGASQFGTSARARSLMAEDIDQPAKVRKPAHIPLQCRPSAAPARHSLWTPPLASFHPCAWRLSGKGQTSVLSKSPRLISSAPVSAPTPR
jgi:hypothetical protein